MTDTSRKRKRPTKASEAPIVPRIPAELCITFCPECPGSGKGTPIRFVNRCDENHPGVPSQMTHVHAIQWYGRSTIEEHLHEGVFQGEDFDTQCGFCFEGCCSKNTPMAETKCQCPCLICQPHTQPVHTIVLVPGAKEDRIEGLVLCDCDTEGFSCICSCLECEERKNDPGVKPSIRK